MNEEINNEEEQKQKSGWVKEEYSEKNTQEQTQDMLSTLLDKADIASLEEALRILETKLTEENRRKDLLKLTVLRGDIDVAKVRKDNKQLLHEISVKLKSLLEQ